MDCIDCICDDGKIARCDLDLARPGDVSPMSCLCDCHRPDLVAVDLVVDDVLSARSRAEGAGQGVLWEGVA